MLAGRDGELGGIEAELARAGGVVAVYVHGPAGIGKTALLRAVAERAAGFELVWIDGRDIAPVPDQLEDALGGSTEGGRPLVVIDCFERVEALGGYLRRVLLPGLPEGAAVLIASRRAPGPEWAAREEGRFLPLALAPLDPEASIEVLRRHGLDGDAAARRRGPATGRTATRWRWSSPRRRRTAVRGRRRTESGSTRTSSRAWSPSGSRAPIWRRSPPRRSPA